VLAQKERGSFAAAADRLAKLKHPPQLLFSATCSCNFKFKCSIISARRVFRAAKKEPELNLTRYIATCSVQWARDEIAPAQLFLFHVAPLPSYPCALNFMRLCLAMPFLFSCTWQRAHNHALGNSANAKAGARIAMYTWEFAPRMSALKIS
jgi:hypothetical protein